MELTPEEQKELDALEAELGTPTGGLTPAEEKELADLERELGPAPTSSAVEAVARGAASSLTMGYAPQITGAIESALTNKTYAQARDESQAEFEEAAKSYPTATLIGEGAGLVGPVATGGLLGAKIIGKVAQEGVKKGIPAGVKLIDYVKSKVAGIDKDDILDAAAWGADQVGIPYVGALRALQRVRKLDKKLGQSVKAPTAAPKGTVKPVKPVEAKAPVPTPPVSAAKPTTVKGSADKSLMDTINEQVATKAPSAGKKLTDRELIDKFIKEKGVTKVPASGGGYDFSNY